MMPAPPFQPGTRPQAFPGFSQAILAFGAMLRAAGLRISTGQLRDFQRSLLYIAITDREEFYLAARCLLLTRHADEPLFNLIFARFWRGVLPRLAAAIDRDAQSDLLHTAGEALAAGRDFQQGATIRLLIDMPSQDDAAAGEDEAEPGGESDTIAAYSAAEVLRRKDFSTLAPDEVAEVRRLIADIRWHTALRRLRRMRRATKGPRTDARRALRQSLATGGELVVLPRRTRRRKPRPLVLICDISGSMERYTSLLLRFLHAVRQGRGGVETFVFGTRLTRITRQLRVRDTDAALQDVAGEVVDWGGGTRIGEAIATFNRRWGRRVLGHGATVVIISDGWDRGDPQLLAHEMAHLQRLSHRLIWLNPLLGLAGYEPLTRGMRAALPFVDDFLASHNLASLEELARFLEGIDEHRPVRGHRDLSQIFPSLAQAT
jgi:uncharacterized protein with von Willebrand factor type A (vWA) domain